MAYCAVLILNNDRLRLFCDVYVCIYMYAVVNISIYYLALSMDEGLWWDRRGEGLPMLISGCMFVWVRFIAC